jgi:phage terminase large subunit GpA-like protein
MLDHHSRALGDVLSPHAAFRPPRRVPVAQGAAESLYFKQPGGVPGLWSADETPYMVDPMNMLASRRHEAVCFVGPARTGKTAGLLLGWMAHNVVNDPGDMLFVQMTQDKAREFSKTDVDRAIRYSPAVQAMMGSSQDDNTHDKMFRHGMWLRIAWPTVSNVSGSTYRYVAITDIDRMTNAENVDGEGPLFNLALKRTQTFLSRGMCLVESSPGIEITDPHWSRATLHEAPPVTGILGIYNRSDRRRLYWKCPLCADWFEASPGLDLFGLPAESTLLEMVREADLEALAVEHNRVVCPHCRGQIGPRSKRELNLNARWLQDGLSLTRTDELVGKAHESSIAGYWLGGVAAAYQSWRSIVLRYLQGLRAYVLTGSEEALKTTVNTDQGAPYMSRVLRDAAASTRDPSQRKEKGLERYVVPPEARFLVASVDIQGGVGSRFVVQVHAVGPHREKWLIDRYNITDSEREGVGGGKAPIDPAAYAEDWDVLTERVLRSTYRTHVEGQEMRVRLTVVDTGGEDGVTERSYAWFRRLRRLGIAGRVMLIKGQGRNAKAVMPLIKESLVGNRNPKEQGDIPLYLVNSNQLKDIVANGLAREVPGPGYFHVPSWVPQAFFDELQSEVRNPDGTWTQIRKRNESFDLLAYCEAGCLRLGSDKINWDRPPDWAKPLSENSERITRDDRRDLQKNEVIAKVEEAALPAPQSRRMPRRSSRSNYLG